MKKILLLIILSLILSGCSPNPKESKEPAITKNSTSEEIVANNEALDETLIELIQFEPAGEEMITGTIKTSEGDMEIVLFPKEAPVAVAAFVRNVEAGVYENAEFSKIMENFYIETTGKTVTAEADSDKKSEQEKEQEPVGVEPNISLWHFRGALSMKENLIDNPQSDLSDFVIVQAKTLPEDIFKEMTTALYPEKVIEKYREAGGIPGYDTNFTVFGQITGGLDILDNITNRRVDENYEPEEETVIIKDVILKIPETK